MRGGESRASAFKVELTALVRRMAATRCRYVRCVNPRRWGRRRRWRPEGRAACLTAAEARRRRRHATASPSWPSTAVASPSSSEPGDAAGGRAGAARLPAPVAAPSVCRHLRRSGGGARRRRRRRAGGARGAHPRGVQHHGRPERHRPDQVFLRARAAVTRSGAGAAPAVRRRHPPPRAPRSRGGTRRRPHLSAGARAARAEAGGGHARRKGADRGTPRGGGTAARGPC